MKKIVVTGTRGIPFIQGGVETHCEELYPRMVRLGFDVNLVMRSWYIIIPEFKLKVFNGVKLSTLYAPHIKGLEAFIHTFLAVIWAKKQKADIIHIHAIGPAIMAPFARFLGLKVVFTHHGCDYERAKWGRFAKFVLKMGERLGTAYANEVIVISEIIQKSLVEKYNRKNTHLIFNGVNTPVFAEQSDFITGNDESLIEGLEQQLNSNFDPANYDLTPYIWNQIALQTAEVYKKVLKKKTTAFENII